MFIYFVTTEVESFVEARAGGVHVIGRQQLGCIDTVVERVVGLEVVKDLLGLAQTRRLEVHL